MHRVLEVGGVRDVGLVQRVARGQLVALLVLEHLLLALRVVGLLGQRPVHRGRTVDEVRAPVGGQPHGGRGGLLFVRGHAARGNAVGKLGGPAMRQPTDRAFLFVSREWDSYLGGGGMRPRTTETTD